MILKNCLLFSLLFSMQVAFALDINQCNFRKHINLINNKDKNIEIKEIKILSESSEGTTLRQFSKNKKLIKTVVNYLGESGQIQMEFSLDKKMVFSKITWLDYKNSLPNIPVSINKKTVLEGFLCDNKVVFLNKQLQNAESVFFSNFVTLITDYKKYVTVE